MIYCNCSNIYIYVYIYICIYICIYIYVYIHISNDKPNYSDTITMILCYQLVLINRMIPASPRNLPTIHGLTDDDRPDLRMALTLCSAWAMKQWLEPLTKARGTRWDRVPQG